MNATQTTEAEQHIAAIACLNADTELYEATIDGVPATGGQHRRIAALAPEARYVGEIALTAAQYDELAEIGRKDRIAAAFADTATATKMGKVAVWSERDDAAVMVRREVKVRQTVGRHRSAFYELAGGLAPHRELQAYFKVKRHELEHPEIAEARIEAEIEAKRKAEEEAEAARIAEAKAKAATEDRPAAGTDMWEVELPAAVMDAVQADARPLKGLVTKHALFEQWAATAAATVPEIGSLAVLDGDGLPCYARDLSGSDADGFAARLRAALRDACKI